MKKKITSKIIYSIMLLVFSFTIVNAQAPHSWRRSSPGYFTGYPIYSTEHRYHESNDVAILSDGSVVTAGVKYQSAWNDSRHNFIEKFSSNGSLLNTFRWDFNYDNCYYVSKIIQMEGSQSNDIYALVRIEYSYPCFIDTPLTLIKLDANLNMLWNIYFTGQVGQFKFVLDANGNPFITYIVADPSTGGQKIVVEKYSNANGSLQWHRNIKDFNGINITAVNDLKVDNGGNAYVCGAVTNAVTLKDFQVVKINTNGTIAWRKYFDGASQNTPSGDDEAFALSVDNDQNIIVTGQSYRTARDYDFLTIKYNPQGDVLWQRRKDVNNKANAGQFIGIDGNNNVYVAGNSETNSALLKYDQYGNLIWQKTYNGFTLSEISASSQGTCYLAGSKIFYGTTIPQANKAHLKKVLSNGVVEWSYSDPKSLNVISPPLQEEYAYESNYNSLALKENLHQVVASGYTGLISKTPSYDWNFANTWLTDNFSPSTRFGIIAIDQYNKDLMVYPNPATNTLQIQFKDEIQQAHLSILDLQGREVMNKTMISGEETINVSELKAGIYFARFTYEGNIITKKFVKE